MPVFALLKGHYKAFVNVEVRARRNLDAQGRPNHVGVVAGFRAIPDNNGVRSPDHRSGVGVIGGYAENEERLSRYFPLTPDFPYLPIPEGFRLSQLVRGNPFRELEHVFMVLPVFSNQSLGLCTTAYELVVAQFLSVLIELVGVGMCQSHLSAVGIRVVCIFPGFRGLVPDPGGVVLQFPGVSTHRPLNFMAETRFKLKALHQQLGNSFLTKLAVKGVKLPGL